jgi:hypothetical protein
MAIIFLKKKITNVGKNVKNVGPSYVIGVNIKWCSCCGRLVVPQKVKHRITLWLNDSTNYSTNTTQKGTQTDYCLGYSNILNSQEQEII